MIFTQQQGQAVKKGLKSLTHSIIDWTWTKALLYWIVLSAGTMSEFAFLIASLWMTLNASIHDFILVFIPEQMTEHLSDIAKAAYVGLPECILALAITTTIGHVRTWHYNRNGWALAWSILYGIPTVIFLGMSLWTIGCSVLKVNYTLPDWMVVTRALAGYSYGVTALLYWFIGKPQEKDRLQEKDDLIDQLKEKHVLFVAQLRQEKDAIITQLQKQIADITIQFQQEKATSLATLGNDKDMVIYRLQQATNSHQETIRLLNEKLGIAHQKIENVEQEKQQLLLDIQRKGPQETTASLEGKPEEIIEWLRSTGRPTIDLSEVSLRTNLSKRKLNYAAKHGGIRHTKNEEIVFIDSLIPWLCQEFSIPNPERNTDKIIRLDERAINE